MTKYDDDTANRRINAYVSYLLEAYDADMAGLATIAGVDHAALIRFNNADFGDKSPSILVALARLTGIRLSFLVAEDQNDEGVA